MNNGMWFFIGFLLGGFLTWKFVRFGLRHVRDKSIDMYGLLRNVKPLYEREKSMGKYADYETLCEYIIDQFAVLDKKDINK